VVAVRVPPTMSARDAKREVRDLITEAKRRFETEMTLARITPPPLAALARADRIEEAAVALLDATPDPADWQAPWMRQLSQAIAGEPVDARPRAGTVGECDACGEGPFRIDGSDPDVETTWQQWECP
jgi:hypothetical protein